MIKYTSEIFRKSIHFSSLWIPGMYLYFTEKTMLSILFPIVLFALIVEISRKCSPELNALINQMFAGIMREKEKNSFSGATYLLISSALSIAIFSKEIAILALTILIISDSCAALVGRKFGRFMIGNKSLEGAGSFFVSAFVIYYFLVVFYNFSLPFGASLMVISAATIVELFAEKIHLDDNFAIPLAIGLVSWII